MLICLLVLMPGCALMPEISSNDKSVSISERVDALFFRQNKASSEVMMLSIEEFDSPELEELIEAESEMQEACEALNEYVIRLVDQLSLGLSLQRRVYSSIDECDEATTDMESLLQEFNTNVAEEQMKNEQTEAD